MDYYGITKDFSQAGFFETESVTALLRDLKTAIYAGGLVAVSGLSGAAKRSPCGAYKIRWRKKEK